MEKKDLIKFCKYYKGEEKNPYEGKEQNEAMFWGYESKWIDFNFTKEGRELLADYITDYVSTGLAMFEMQDDTPASLKALLFNRYCHWSSGSMIDCVEPFKTFYKKYYK